VSHPGPIDLRCEIDSIEEPVEGRVSDERGRSLPFRGWIEFSVALSSLARDADQQEPEPQQEDQSDA
jgi:hypothetical protein